MMPIRLFSTRLLFSIALAHFALFALPGCGKQGETEMPSRADGGAGGGAPGARAEQQTPKLVVAVIPKGTTHVFWKSVQAGAEKAGSEMNAEIRWQGPQKESDTARQLEIVENAITNKVDGIVLAPLDKDALVRGIEKAKAANIPLTIFDSAANTEQYLSFVATDNKKGGQIAAERMGKLLNGKGKVAMILVQPNSASTGDREAGFEETIKARFPGITVIRSNYGNSDRAQSLRVTEDVLTANPDITGIFGPNESSTVGALQALKNRNLLGKIKLVGFDSTKQLEASLEKGEIDSLVLQNPFKMGYEGVKTIVENKAGKKPEKRIDTGVALMTRENMNFAEMQAVRSKE